MRRITTVLALAIVSTVSARGQGFVNLNFESAYDLTNPPESGEPVSVGNALPGWIAYGGVALSDVYYVSNTFTGVSTLVELEGGSLALSGDFSAGLFDGGSISQTGSVPVNAESLQFEATAKPPNLEVTLGGQSLAYSALSKGPDYTIFGVNIPAAMDGQTEALTFLVQGPGASALLDNIEFSPTSVPEPSEFALIFVGTILVGIRFWRKSIKSIRRPQ